MNQMGDVEVTNINGLHEMGMNTSYLNNTKMVKWTLRMKFLRFSATNHDDSGCLANRDRAS